MATTRIPQAVKKMPGQPNVKTRVLHNFTSIFSFHMLSLNVLHYLKTCSVSHTRQPQFLTSVLPTVGVTLPFNLELVSSQPSILILTSQW